MLYAFYACLAILYIKLAVFNSQITDTCRGRQGAGAREKGYERRERKEREAGVFRGREAGDHVDEKYNK